MHKNPYDLNLPAGKKAVEAVRRLRPYELTPLEKKSKDKLKRPTDTRTNNPYNLS